MAVPPFPAWRGRKKKVTTVQPLPLGGFGSKGEERLPCGPERVRIPLSLDLLPGASNRISRRQGLRFFDSTALHLRTGPREVLGPDVLETDEIESGWCAGALPEKDTEGIGGVPSRGSLDVAEDKGRLDITVLLLTR